MKHSYIIIAAVFMGLVLGGGLGWWRLQLTRIPVHRTYFVQQTDFYDAAYQDTNKIAGINRHIRGLLVNHHLLAANLIAQAFTQVASNESTTVILLSPNHFDAGSGKFLTSVGDWQTPYGDVAADKKLIQQLVKNNLVKIDEQPFDKEHGVGNIVPFIRHSLPKAKIVPIILRNNLTSIEVKDWTEKSSPYLPKNSLIVASLDMSHYVAEAIAARQDAKTIDAIKAIDSVAAWDQAVDSPAALSAYLQLIQSFGNLRFHLLARSSSTLLGGALPKDNTSYITGFFY